MRLDKNTVYGAGNTASLRSLGTGLGTGPRFMVMVNPSVQSTRKCEITILLESNTNQSLIKEIFLHVKELVLMRKCTPHIRFLLS